MTFDEIRKNYADPLTLEDVRIILHISKRKAAWLLQNQYIKCTDTGKKTHRYSIETDDLIEYIKQVESGQLVIPASNGIFTAHETQSHLDTIAFPKNLPADFKQWIEREWKKEKDALVQSDIVRITGYSKKTIQRWITKKNLNCIRIQSGYVIPKASLIDFYCDKGYKTIKKSEKHIRLLKKYYKM